MELAELPEPWPAFPKAAAEHVAPITGGTTSGSTDDGGGHPADRLVRELICVRRSATPDETDAILERMATAPFNEQIVRVPANLRGLSYLGRLLERRADSAFLHLVQRVVVD